MTFDFLGKSSKDVSKLLIKEMWWWEADYSLAKEILQKRRGREGENFKVSNT